MLHAIHKKSTGGISSDYSITNIKTRLKTKAVISDVLYISRNDCIFSPEKVIIRDRKGDVDLEFFTG